MQLPVTSIVFFACALAAALGSASTRAQECAAPAIEHKPITVTYRGVETLAITLTASADGTVRATDSETGATLWTFTAPEAIATRERGLTGLISSPRVLRFDANGDGAVDVGDGDRVWLYFGLRRAGPFYYALDISDPSRSRVLWKRGADSLDGLADAWSPPAIARVRISGAAQNGEHFVIIIGGGYANATSVSAGNRIFMLDAATGQRLWSAGGVSQKETPDLLLEKMIHPVPAGIAVLDVDGDDYADRFYAVDLAGQVFRFDVWNGRARTELVTGGVLADLSAPVGPVPPANGTARFFNKPDVALIVPRAGAPYYNLALGSGDADGTAPPLVPNRFYSIRDPNVFTALTQPAYDLLDPVLATDLIDITADVNALVPRDAKGWRMDLAPPDVLALGEQVLSESITVNKVVLFTTYQPERGPESAPADEGACEETGSSRVYAVRVDTGAAAVDLDSDGEITPSDRSVEMQHAGPPAAVSIEIANPGAGGTVPPPTDAPPDDPDAPQPPSPNEAVQCIVGTRVLKTCVPFSPLQRTYWHRATVE